MKNMQDRRSEVRMMCADMVEVRFKDEKGKSRRMTCLLEDISHSGACLQFDSPVPKGVEIRWKSGQQEFRGRVQYCVYREIGYFVGVQFDAGTQWSKKSFEPQHMLDLEKLMEGAKK